MHYYYLDIYRSSKGCCIIFPKPIVFDSKSNMSAAFTDRLASFLHFHADFNEKSYGLVRGETSLLKDFCFIDASQRLITRKDCLKMILRPAALEFVFDGFSLFFSLLFTNKQDPTLCIRSFSHKNNGNLASQLVLLVGENINTYWKCSSKISGPHDTNVSLRETTTSEKNIIYQEFPVYGNNPLILTGTESSYTLFISLHTQKHHDYNKSIAFIEKKSFSSKLLKKHGKAIRDFFSSFSFTLDPSEVDKKVKIGNQDFNNALLWSLFSAWMMVTGLKHRGIWAGLPWFCDNWGRDTFIALPGVLLVSGCFEEAKNVIRSFARYQDKNPESPSYGRIPNRYRNKKDVIYNTVDGTLWFIREVWEYAEYTGDKQFLKKMFPVVSLALESDRQRRCDGYGFLTHAHSDTWMDARIENAEPLSPRADRACDIQALWYTALKIGSRMAAILHKQQLSELWEKEAERVKKHFLEFFVAKESLKIADYLHEDGERDESIRPNQLFCVTVPSILDTENFNTGEKSFVDMEIRAQIGKEVFTKLTMPYGVLSLSQDHEHFHPFHDSSAFYHKDSAYHNGTIWLWNTGPLVQTMNLLYAQDAVYELTRSHVEQIVSTEPHRWTSRCAGTLSENMDAYPDRNGMLHPSGTFSQTWSLSEFSRNAFSSYAGIKPSLLFNRIFIRPSFPREWKKGHIVFSAGTSQYRLSWHTEDTHRIRFSLEREESREKQKYKSVEIIILLALEKDTKELKEQRFYLSDGVSCLFSGFIPQADVEYEFATQLYSMAGSKKPNALKEPNYLYNKIKGIKRD